METFVYIKWVKGLYEIGDKGTVLNSQKALSQKTKSNGYKEVCLYVDKTPKMCYVHRLVAEAWIGDIPKGHYVNHVDGNKSNNRLDNLEIVTPSENSLHSYHVLGNKTPLYKGSEHPMAKLTEDNVREIRQLHKEGLSPRKINKIWNNISYGSICKICYNQTWKHII